MRDVTVDAAFSRSLIQLLTQKKTNSPLAYDRDHEKMPCLLGRTNATGETNMKDLLKAAANFKNNQHSNEHALYQELGNGQSPQTLFITCSDSRIEPNLLTGTKAGELFVIRNAGNIVDKYDAKNPTNEAITLEYAVKALQVKEIIVCGHAKCGAMGAVCDLASLDAVPLVQRKLSQLEYYTKKVDTSDLNNVIDYNVTEQIKNLKSYPFVQEAVDNKALVIRGWVYDFVSGDVKVVEQGE
jgi:carbonic anhydrase